MQKVRTSEKSQWMFKNSIKVTLWFSEQKIKFCVMLQQAKLGILRILS